MKLYAKDFDEDSERSSDWVVLSEFDVALDCCVTLPPSLAAYR